MEFNRHGNFHGFVLSYFIGWYYALPTRARGKKKRYNQTSWFSLAPPFNKINSPHQSQKMVVWGEKIGWKKIEIKVKKDIEKQKTMYIIQRHGLATYIIYIYIKFDINNERRFREDIRWFTCLFCTRSDGWKITIFNFKIEKKGGTSGRVFFLCV